MDDDIEWLANLLGGTVDKGPYYGGYDEYFKAIEDLSEDPYIDLDDLDLL